MNSYTALILGPRGGLAHIDLLADDMAHARELALEEARALYGRHPFRFTVKPA